MGVRGWNRLLSQEGWLPTIDYNSSSTSLWMDAAILEADNNNNNNNTTALTDRLVTIPAGSELHVDGFALCFHLHSVAYARYRNQFFGLAGRKKKSASEWAVWQVRQSLPQFLPLEFMELVTQEFVDELQTKRGMKLVVYWDGELRYAPPSNAVDDNVASSFKHETEVHRQSNRVDEWSNLQQYCLHGKVPAQPETWERDFPKNHLFITQVMHTLMTMTMTTNSTSTSTGSCDMVFCQEEADSLMAQAVTGQPNAYIVGMDSDFCFFPDANYIPLPTLLLDNDDNGNNNLQAVVIRRDLLAKSLDLPDESLMVDLAILLGNDYVNASSHAELDLPADVAKAVVVDDSKQYKKGRNSNVRIDAILKYLRNADTDNDNNVVVTAHTNPHVQACLTFVRNIYNLQDMSDYPLQESLSREDGTIMPVVDDKSFLSGLSDIVVDPDQGDTGVHDAVVRYLQRLVDHQVTAASASSSEEDSSFLDTFHIETFQKLHSDWQQQSNEGGNTTKAASYSIADKNATNKAWRPLWKDVPAVYWIEKATSKVIQNTLRQALERGDTIIDTVDAPTAIFDTYLYHALLLSTRAKDNDNDDDAANGTDATVAEAAGESSLDQAATQEQPAPVARLVLPVDEFEDTIVESVQKNRVTIIQGETGCGKSSRIPIMLLNKLKPPDPSHAATKLFVSVPRRIAAKALVERLRSVEPELKDEIALRMGHGVREYETKSTRAWFVTSGYLVRLMANHPERFDNISVLIIDEVHERSVDTDILCLLCRRLLKTNPHLRLVLMSATLAAKLYQDYFGVPELPIKVGARRFPVREVYLDDLAKEVTLSSGDSKKVKSLLLECEKLKGKKTPSAQYLEKVHAIVSNLATVLGEPGSSVLIFVPGMNDIVAITDNIEKIHVPGINFNCIPIHSDIPFEDQMSVFDSALANEVKIILGTNACESSVTLPDVDHVICLGLCKQIVYNEASHRQMLMPTWISKASATQRAGRTGRVRPGTVYRMYTRSTYESYMDEFEPGEMLRIPLDSVILMLKEMLTDDAITEVLQSCLEPPNLTTIERSFESLYKSRFITTPDDSCEITTLGGFVSSLGIDLALGSLIGLGIQMGVGAEAIQIAAILSFPKPPWIMSNALIHPIKEFNEQTKKTFVSRNHFDSGLYSEPLAIMNLLWDYEHLKGKKQQDWCWFYGIFPARIRRLVTTAQNLRKRVADFVGIQESLLSVSKPPSNMPHGMITILRVIQVWVFSETVIQLDPKKFQKNVSEEGLRIALQPKSDQVEPEHLDQILMKGRHTHALESSSEIVQKGTFSYFEKRDSSSAGEEFSERLETHLLSYCIEKGVDCAWIAFSDSLTLYYRSDSTLEVDLLEVVMGATRFEETNLIATSGKTRRGIGERACGMWELGEGAGADNSSKTVAWQKFCTTGNLKKKKMNESAQRLWQIAKSIPGKVVSFKFPWTVASFEANRNVQFAATLFGSTSPLADIDLRDMLGPSLQMSSMKKNVSAQKIFFPLIESTPFTNEGIGAMITKEFDRNQPGSSWERPMMDCTPEGARLLAVLGTLRRRDEIKLALKTDQKANARKDGGSKEEGKTEDTELEICLEKGHNVAFRWNRFDSNDTVYVDGNSVPASAIPVKFSGMMYCICANTLELRNGGLRAEGLTLLPLGKEFLMLSRISFGLFDERNVEDGTIAEVSIAWAKCEKARRKVLVDRVWKAVEFHNSAMELGESLECFPGKIHELLAIFDNMDGYESTPWDTLDSNPFISDNLQAHKTNLENNKTTRFHRRESSAIDTTDGEKKTAVESRSTRKSTPASPYATNTVVPYPSITSTSKKAVVPYPAIALTPKKASNLSKSEEQEILRLLERQTSGNELRATRVLGVVLRQTRCELSNATTLTSYQHSSADWEIKTIEKQSKTWYKAIFSAPDLLYIRRASVKLPAWMRAENSADARPIIFADALSCMPAAFEDLIGPMTLSMSDSAGLYFKSLEIAIQMEAAFWLERQFTTKKQQWFDHDLASGTMQDRLLQEFKAVATRGGRSPKKSPKKKQQKNGDRKLPSEEATPGNGNSNDCSFRSPQKSKKKKKQKTPKKAKLAPDGDADGDNTDIVAQAASWLAELNI